MQEEEELTANKRRIKADISFAGLIMGVGCFELTSAPVLADWALKFQRSFFDPRLSI
jgi:hypothetical protein